MSPGGQNDRLRGNSARRTDRFVTVASVGTVRRSEVLVGGVAW